MRKLKFLAILIIISCHQTQDEVKKQSLDDVFFYLSNYRIVDRVEEIKLVYVKKVTKEEYEIRYKIKNNDSLWIIQYYDENTYFMSFTYNTSNHIDKITDSVDNIRYIKRDFPLHKRWKWVGEVSK
jgi:hypothetical protein